MLTKMFEFLMANLGLVLLASSIVLMAVAALLRRRWFQTAAWVALTVWLLLYGSSGENYLHGLSADSLSETSSPSADEALFFASSVIQIFEPASIRRVLILVAAIAFVAGFAGLLLRPRRTSWILRIHRVGAISAGFVLLFNVISLALNYAASANQIEQIKGNFQNPPRPFKGAPRPIKVIVYIGESTSSLNWHLYGYGRQTTPELDARKASDPGLLVYQSALSTHTHTAASLMDALGLPVVSPAASRRLPIYERRYVSVVDQLAAAGVQSALLSNQGLHGSWNAGGKVVFGSAQWKRAAFNDAMLGNASSDIEHVPDDQFFSEQLAPAWRSGQPQVLFLHSYAGHGPYLRNIPESFRRPVDDSLSDMDPRGVVGDLLTAPETLVANIEAYDSAMTYVDHAVNRAIGTTAEQPEPTILIYFSDHGESPWTGRGHDSARFQHEMMRVPLLMYFNAAARAREPELFRRYQRDAEVARPRLLSSIAGTLLDLFGVTTQPAATRLLDDQMQEANAGLVVRKIDGITSVISPLAIVGPGLQNDSDLATRIFVALTQRDEARVSSDAVLGPSYCYHRADTLARARRAAATADCVEFDVANNPSTGELEVFHPPAAPTGYTLSKAFDALEGSGKGVWIDAKDIDNPIHCEKLATALEQWSRKPKQVLVEFPPTVLFSEPKIARCVGRLRSMQIRRSFYVPPLADACATLSNPTCSQYQKTVTAAVESGLFSDLSFDESGLEMMRRIPAASRLRWNTWAIPVARVGESSYKNYGFVIVDSAGDLNFH